MTVVNTIRRTFARTIMHVLIWVRGSIEANLFELSSQAYWTAAARCGQAVDAK